MGDDLLVGWLIGWWLARWLDVWLTGGLIGGAGRLVIWVALDLAGYLAGCLRDYLVGWQTIWLTI